MKPYWSSSDHKLSIYHGDCLEVLPQLEQEFDLCLTDFDYFIDNDTMISGSDRFPRKKAYESKFFDSALLGDGAAQKAFTWAVLDEVRLREGCVACCFHSNNKIGWLWEWAEANEWVPVQPYVWVKSNPMPQLRKVKWANGIEQAAIIAKPGKRHYNPEHGHRPNYVVLPVGKRYRHPTEKPVALFEPVIASWTFQGDTVLDPFLGSGTTLSACHRLGRCGVGIEISEEYCELAAKRLEKEMAQLRLPEPQDIPQAKQAVLPGTTTCAPEKSVV